MPKTLRLALSVSVPVVAALIVNGIIYLNRLNEQTAEETRFLPPGPVVGAIWVFLFALFGYVFYLLRWGSLSPCPSGAWAVAALIVYCLSYPFVTSLRSGTRATSVANVFALVIVATCIMVVQRCGMQNRAVACLLPAFAWASYVNVAQALSVASSHRGSAF
jgi:tryptophan-rich sensory protein